MEYKQELDYIDQWYRKLKGTEYIKDYGEIRFFGNTSVAITVTKEIIKKINPKVELYLIKGTVMDGEETIMTVKYIL